MRYLNPILAAGLLTFAMSAANATSATLTPVGGNQHTDITATVSEQVALTVPATAAFSVPDVNSSAATTSLSVTASSIVLTDGHTLRLSLQPAADNFSGPTGSTHDLSVANVSWGAVAWTGGAGGVGTAGALVDSSTASEVATSTANAPTLSTTALVLTLASDPLIDRAGDYTLRANWIVESVAP